MKNRVKILRVEKGITQGDLAEKISVSRQTIHAIESGKYIPSTLLALKLSRVLNKTVEDLFELEDRD
jgi:putative transcriptional regulator